MISEFHGKNKMTHDAFQVWRQSHVDGFHMTESARGVFTVDGVVNARHFGGNAQN